jgi:hypothetical protein
LQGLTPPTTPPSAQSQFLPPVAGEQRSQDKILILLLPSKDTELFQNPSVPAFVVVGARITQTSFRLHWGKRKGDALNAIDISC